MGNGRCDCGAVQSWVKPTEAPGAGRRKHIADGPEGAASRGASKAKVDPPKFGSRGVNRAVFGMSRFCSFVCYGRRMVTLLVTGLIWTVAKLAGFIPSGLASFSWWTVRNQFASGMLLVAVTVPLGRMVKDLN